MFRENNDNSWGRTFHPEHEHTYLYWQDEARSLPHINDLYLPQGLARSYGDACLNDGHHLVKMRGLNKFISFDENEGLITAEAGVSLSEILQVCVPKGWFLPVTPGTKHVTLGGAIANDVHGKNHHAAGTFGCYVESLSLFRSDRGPVICSERENAELFHATIGGMGLTGLILWAKFRLIPIKTAFIHQQSLKLNSLEDFFRHTDESDKNYKYTVSWIDTLATGKQLGRGLLMRGNFAEKVPSKIKNPLQVHGPSLIQVPIQAPNFLLNRFSNSVFNFGFYHKQLKKMQTGIVHYDPFFYPLDVVDQWNLLYGDRGFFQYQCVLAPENGFDGMRKLIELIAVSGEASFLTVLKKFGEAQSPGLMSFPRPGLTLALDFPNRGAKTAELFAKLDEVVRKFSGAIYPAKDARMTGADFKQFFPNWPNFSQHIDPKISSSLWRRVMNIPAT